MVVTLEEERKKLNKENVHLKENNIVLQNEIENIKKSTSWKITEPIRKLKTTVNHIRRHN